LLEGNVYVTYWDMRRLGALTDYCIVFMCVI